MNESNGNICQEGFDKKSNSLSIYSPASCDNCFNNLIGKKIAKIY